MRSKKLNRDFTLHTLPGEIPIAYGGTMWEYVSQRFANGDRTQIYYHIDCDSITVESGHCLICGAASPAAY